MQREPGGAGGVASEAAPWHRVRGLPRRQVLGVGRHTSRSGERSRGFGRAGGAALGAFGEIFDNHAAEHQRIEAHAADVNEDDDGDGDGGDGRRRRGR